jgi:hypothetical protein
MDPATRTGRRGGFQRVMVPRISVTSWWRSTARQPGRRCWSRPPSQGSVKPTGIYWWAERRETSAKRYLETVAGRRLGKVVLLTIHEDDATILGVPPQPIRSNQAACAPAKHQHSSPAAHPISSEHQNSVSPPDPPGCNHVAAPAWTSTPATSVMIE